MTIEFIQKQYYWIPRSGNSPTDFETSPNYAQVPASIGGWQWITDTPDPLGANYGHLYLPTWFPRKAFINKVWLGAGCNGNTGTLNELAAWVDPGGVAYASANGAEAGSNFTQDISLGHLKWYGFSVVECFDHEAPVLLDRDAGDKLGFMCHNSQDVAYVFCGIGFLFPAPYQPT